MNKSGRQKVIVSGLFRCTTWYTKLTAKRGQLML